MKRTLTMTLAVLMLMGMFAAAEESDAATADITPSVTETGVTNYTLSLSQAIELALADNPQINAADINTESCKTSVKAAKEARAKCNGRVNTIAYLNTDYAVEAAEKQLFLAEKSKEQIKSKISYDVTQKYYNYKLLCHLLEIADNSLALAKENLSVVNANYELGRISKIENDNAALSVESCEATKNTYIRNASIAKESLKIALNIENEAEFNLTDDINYEVYEAVPQTDAEAAIETRYDMSALKVQAELADKNFNNIKRYSSENTAAYQTAYSSYIQSDYTYTNSAKQMKIGIINYYNSILSAKDALEIANMTYDIQSRNYEAGKLKFEMGTISNIELTELLNKQSSAQADVENAKLNYKLAVEKYKYEITIGL